jgi:hypothetical protein
MKKILVYVLVTFSCYIAVAGDGEYDVSKIDKKLLKNANAVLRLEEVSYEIINLTRATEKNRYVITILNEKGSDWAAFYDWYNKHKEIVSIEGTLYDASGKQIKKIRKKDTEDMSGTDESSLIDDNRIRRHNFYYRVYPYTIEYEVVTEYKATLFFPSWTPQGNEKISVEKSSVTYTFPQDYKLRFKSFNYPGEPTQTFIKNKKEMKWSVENVPAILREPMAPMWHEISTMVIFGPSDFQMDDYKGNMASWQDFGKFIYSLKEDRQELPENVKKSIHEIADPISDEHEKVRKLYEFMQKHTRYISIQLGIALMVL